MKWNFASHSDYLDNVGFKDNDIEKFSQDTVKSLVREALQNSCDALDESNGKSQVLVVIKKNKFKKTLLPNFSKIEEHILACLNDENDTAENREIERHLKAIETEEYSCLEIADYNTTGMDQKSFESLTQGIFKSTKSNSGSQGSKGVGKAAYYAASYLRTMLITSASDDGVRFRAVAKLSNHFDPDRKDQKLNYKGFYGDANVVNINSIPTLFKRTDKGTSIFIIGIWKTDNLDDEIIKEVLRNYWFAILRNQLVVVVNDIELNAENLERFLKVFFFDYRDYQTGEKQNPRPYFDTVVFGKEYKKNISNIGVCSLWLHQNEMYNLGAVARFRKTKMLIYKEKNLDVGFAGVFLCDNEIGNSFLKEIENDAHDIWNDKINQDYREKAKTTLREIKDFIVESYNNFAGIDNKTSFSIDNIDELFSFSKGNEISKRNGAAPKTKKEPPETTNERLIESAKFKSFFERDQIFYRLEIHSKVQRYNQRFKITIGTDSSRDIIHLKDSSAGKYNDNILTLDIVQGLNIIDKIELDSPFLVAPVLTSIVD